MFEPLVSGALEEASMEDEAMDWTGCEWVEVVAGWMGGVPTVIASRVTPEVLVECFDDGDSVGAIAWNYRTCGAGELRGDGDPETAEQTLGASV